MAIIQKGKIPHWEIEVKCKLCNTNYTLEYKDIWPMIDNSKITRVAFIYKCPE